jgi:DNA primase
MAAAQGADGRGSSPAGRSGQPAATTSPVAARAGALGRNRDGALWSGGGRRAGDGRPGAGARGGERAAFGRGNRDELRHRLVETPAEAGEGAHTLLDRRERAERAFLALCLALPDDGERRLADADLDALFSAPATRRAAAHLRGRLHSPAASLPRDDEPLARVVAELVVRAAELDATPAALDLEALQLDLARLDREIARARSRSEGSRVRDRAGERQRVLDVLRHRLQ